tara:strand:+ start:42906 stop:43778 length:873 start_codon:yes stop_codon:yes gene_type:complete
MKTFAPSELTLNEAGKIYHLNIAAEDVADTVILVGDPDRVKFVGTFFDSIRFETQNREFCTLTGSFNGKDLTVMSTGIGTDNIDIVLNELDAVVNIDLMTRTERAEQKSLDLVRIGTCGALHADIEPGAHIISKYAIGLDGMAHFYEMPYTDDEKNALTSFYNTVNWSSKLNPPYIKKSNDRLRELLKEGMEEGITTTANGFYGPQGRAIRIPLSLPDFKEDLRQFNWQGIRATNLEMETSGLYALADALGHNAVTVCLVLANRYSNKFDPNYKDKMAELIRLILHRLTK